MRIKCCWVLVILLSFNCERLLAQEDEYTDYYLIRRNYENLLENDPRALPLINKYLNKAKKEKKYDKLYQGYSDAVLYSPLPTSKLKYADSTICPAWLSKNNQLVIEAYLEKGVVYYFHFKKYNLALDEYLKAYNLTNDETDKHLRNKLIYLIGVVKSYIGYYDEAFTSFKQSITYFEKESKKKLHPNLKYNALRGYFNNLHQMSVCNRHLGHYKSVDSIINLGLNSTKNNKEYVQEHGYFIKEKGISYYRNKQYQKAIQALVQALKPISSVSDFAWETVCYSYIGKAYLALNQRDKAKEYFEKVDLIFQQHNFILPEVRDSYELLIKHYRDEDDLVKQLYYTNELLRVDRFLFKDFAYLSSKIHREYDTKELKKEKLRLEREIYLKKLVNVCLGILAAFFFIVCVFWFKKEQKIKKKYEILKEKIINEKPQTLQPLVPQLKDIDKLGIDPKIVEDIVQKLNNFEHNLGFVENGLTLAKLAKKLDTNTLYLSQVINELKGINFKKYIGELRIRYITNKLYNDRKYLNFKIETLAEECGIASRTNFSNLFQDINGMRPVDFIKERQKEVKGEKKQEDDD